MSKNFNTIVNDIVKFACPKVDGVVEKASCLIVERRQALHSEKKEEEEDYFLLKNNNDGKKRTLKKCMETKHNDS